MIFIDLKCGRSVYLTDLVYCQSYGGLLDGVPNERMNKQIADEAEENPIWGQVKTCVIPPVISFRSGYPVLPSTKLSAWLASED